MTKTKLGNTSDFIEGKSKLVNVSGMPIAVYRIAGNFHAIYDRCSHRGGSLSRGILTGITVACPLHGAEFDVTTGKNLSPPAPEPVRYFKVSREGEELFIEL